VSSATNRSPDADVIQRSPEDGIAFTPQKLQAYCEDLARRARTAARSLANATGSQKNHWLLDVAGALEAQVATVLEANACDVAANKEKLTEAELDRLRLTPARIQAAAAGLREVARLPDPIGRILDSSVRPNGLQVLKVGVPLGVVFFMYESRPNVTVDAAGLCIKSGNAIILRGGKEALHSNTALHRILQRPMAANGLPEEALQLVATPDRAAVGHLLRLNQFIDLAIARGGESLIRHVVAEATMPVLKHFQGICHVYVDSEVDQNMAERVVVNAKCQRPGVCNAAECLLVHQDVADTFLPRVARALQERGVEMRGCEITRRLVPTAKPASDQDYRTEYLAKIISVKVVASLDEAMEHIHRYGSQHTEAIITNNLGAARRFTAEVDASAVLVNASTRFNDGYEFGLGAEIGISTDKFHARGPCGLQELTTYKYIVHGAGQVRE
jgi:glutamate-5-semialdehyde dehydrogenase